MKNILVCSLLVGSLTLGGCAGMSDTEQRTLSGAAIGTAGGAAIGAIAGNAALGAVVGAGAGLLGGFMVDRTEKNKEQAYQEGMVLGHYYGRDPEWRPLYDYRPYQEFVRAR